MSTKNSKLSPKKKGLSKKNTNWVDEAFDEAFKGRTQKPLTRKRNRDSMFHRVLRETKNKLKKGVLKMDTIKKTFNQVPKFFALLVLASGFIYSVRQIADTDPYLTGLGILSAVLLIEKASK